jgi:hypothetical protein
MGLLKKVGNFVGDLGKGIAKVTVAPLESVTGREQYKPKFRTKAGGTIARSMDKGTKALHIAGKSFADTVTMGNATKLANKVRKKEYRESAYSYNEMKNISRDKFGIKPLDKAYNLAGAGAVVVGQAFGARALAGGTGKVLNKLNSMKVNSEDPGPMEEKQSGGFPIGLFAAAFAAAKLLK